MLNDVVFREGAAHETEVLGVHVWDEAGETVRGGTEFVDGGAF